MSASLRVLLVEDSADDAMLVGHELRRGGYEPEVERVQTAEALEEALRSKEGWDIVISDYYLPDFRGPEVLRIFKEAGLDAPFIVISGLVGEEAAVEMMKAGASDYIMKDSLRKLSSAVARELREAETRRRYRKAELALQESEERYRLLAETATDTIVTIDEDGRMLFVNRAAEEMFGYSISEMLGKELTMLMPEHLREAYRSAFRRYLESGRRHMQWDSLQLPGLHKSGREIPLEVSFNEFVKEGRHYFTGFIRDITERKRAEEVLRRSEQRLADAQRMANIGNFDYDIAADRAVWSDELFRIFGFTPGEFVPNYRSFLRSIHPEDRRFVRRAVRDALREVDRTGIEYRIVRPDGGIRFVHTRCETVRSASGRPVRLVGTIQDVTGRKHAEEERDRFFTLSLDLLCIADFEGRFRRVNPAFKETLGYSEEELLSRPFIELVHPDDRAMTVREIENLGAGTPTLHFENRYRCKDGSFVWFSWRAVPVVEEGLIYATARDVTGRKRIEGVLRTRARQQEAVAELGRRALAGTNLQTFMDRAVELVAGALELEYCKILELLPDGEGMALRAGVGWREGLVGRAIVGAGRDSQAGYTLLSEEPVVVEDLRSETRFSGPPLLREHGVVSGMSTVIGSREKPFGVLGAHTGERREFTEDDVNFLEAVANVIATAIDRNEAEEELARLASYPLLNPNSIIETTVAGEPTYLNPAAGRLFPDIGERGGEHPMLAGLEEVEREILASGKLAEREVRVGERFYQQVISRLSGSGLLRIYATDTTERRRAEDALRESERRFRSLVQNASDITFVVDEDGRITYESPAVERVLGFKPEERVGLTAFDLLHPDDVERAREVFTELVGNPNGHALIEYRVRDNAGLWRHFEGLGTNLLHDPAVRGIVVNSREITERKRMEEALRQSEERYRAVVEQASEGIFLVDVDTRRILEANAAYQELLGYTAEEILRLKLYDVVPYSAEDMDCYVRRVIERGTYVSGERRHRRKDGSLVDVEVSANLISYGGHEVICIVVHDVTERKRAEEALRQSEELYRTVVEQAAENIFLVDFETKRVLEANNTLYRTLGYTAEEMRQMTLYDIVAADPESVDRNIQRVRDRGRRFIGERRYRRKDGSVVYVEVSASAISYRGREAMCIVAHDVTERKRAEDALRFLAEVSVELTSSLDYRTTVSSVARLAVPRLADWCAVDMLEDDGSTDRLAVAHVDPEKVRWAHELHERYPPDPDAPYGVPKVLRTGRAEFYPEISDDLLEAAALDEGHLRMLREVGFTSAMVVPLIARGKTLGAITLASAESGRRFDGADLELAGLLARRVALAVDNALLYEEARKEIAERLRAEQDLRDSRDQLEIILRGVTDGITAQDATGRLVYANEAAARIIGYPSARALTETPVAEVISGFEVMDEAGKPFPPENLPGRRVLRGEEGGEEVLRFRAVETGEERWAVVSATPVLDEEGRVRLAINIFRDITERKRAEEALNAAREAERSRIARELHDDTLQHLIYGLQEVQIKQALAASKDEDLEDVADALRRSVEGLRTAIFELRLGETIEQSFDISLEALIELNRRMARKRYEIDLEIPDEFPRKLLPEKGRGLIRILQEALNNIRRHSGASVARVMLGIDGDMAWAEVVDDGRGFDPESSRGGVGTHSMRQRAEELGGRLEIRSVVGEGTCVRFEAPVPVLTGSE